jgi:hypothetical protein
MARRTPNLQTRSQYGSYCIGNICQGSVSVVGIVENLGTTNNLSNNIGT